MTKKITPIIDSIDALIKHCEHEESLIVHIHRLRRYVRDHRDKDSVLSARVVHTMNNKIYRKSSRSGMAI